MCAFTRCTCPSAPLRSSHPAFKNVISIDFSGGIRHHVTWEPFQIVLRDEAEVFYLCAQPLVHRKCCTWSRLCTGKGEKRFYHWPVILSWRLWSASLVMHVAVSSGSKARCCFSLCVYLEKKGEVSVMVNPVFSSVYFWNCATQGAGSAQVSCHFFFFFSFGLLFAECWGSVFECACSDEHFSVYCDDDNSAAVCL